MKGNKKQVRPINNRGNKGNMSRKRWPYKDSELENDTDGVRIRADMKYSVVYLVIQYKAK